MKLTSQNENILKGGDELRKSLGFRIQRLRKEKGLTQSFVAKKLGYKYPSIISEIESDKKRISAEKLYLLAEILDVDINEFYKDENSQNEKGFSLI
ncbi:helix-turn-helix domain-containing protein [Pseudogracilibacillus sp. SO30301A]|uniref:helix-turn-helix domain-containing protein n=1 Tax=Pseudogracilibacillus sp. SO30301A TaxID=3098291 RepID=UPI00300DD241